MKEEKMVPLRKQVPVKYQTPYCHSEKMQPITTYRGNDGSLYRTFHCKRCKRMAEVKITSAVEFGLRGEV